MADYDCIVLGAGMAGLTAARDLSEQGLSVLVLEGSNRIGGRVRTIDWDDDSPLEIGAELIHRTGQELPLFWHEIRRYDLDVVDIDKPDMFDPKATFCKKAVQVYLERWRENGESGFRDGIDVIKDKPFREGHGVIKEVKLFRKGKDESIGEFIKDELGPLTSAPKSQDAHAVADLMFTGTVHGYFDNQSVVGTKTDDIYGQESSAEEYHVVGGYRKLIDSIANGLKIIKKAKIAKVERFAKRVKVTTVDGVEYAGKSCICTFSIGMLKTEVEAGGVEFKPKFSAKRRKALDRIGMGAVNKITIEFKKRVWPENPKLSLITSPSETYRSFFFPFYNQADRPIITALIEREKAEELDTLMGKTTNRRVVNPGGSGQSHKSDKMVKEIVEQLGGMFEQSLSLADVKQYHAMAWGNEPLVRGGTSFIKYTGATHKEVKQIRRTLATPDGPLHWAGEATAYRTNAFSVHGAHNSGQLAAKLVVDFLKGKPLKMPPVPRPKKRHRSFQDRK